MFETAACRGGDDGESVSDLLGGVIKTQQYRILDNFDSFDAGDTKIDIEGYFTRRFHT